MARISLLPSTSWSLVVVVVVTQKLMERGPQAVVALADTEQIRLFLLSIPHIRLLLVPVEAQEPQQQTGLIRYLIHLLLLAGAVAAAIM